MTRAKTTCHYCGEVLVDIDEIVLDLEEHRYHFTCPKCDDHVTRSASSKVENLLKENGAKVLSRLPDPGLFASVLDSEYGDEILHHWLKD